jgi:CRISPR-associated protein Csx16
MNHNEFNDYCAEIERREVEEMMRYESNIVIVTRHSGAVEWLRQRAITGNVISHVADASQVEGQDVYGSLPFHLAAVANSVTVIDMPRLRSDQRGQDLTPAQMDEAGATLKRYVVRTSRQVAIEAMYNE